MHFPLLPSWATREAKKKETFKGGKSWDWKAERDKHTADPEAYVAGIQRSLDGARERILQGIEAGDIVEAANSGDPQLIEMQDMINHMARASGQLETTPKLLIHKPTYYHDMAKFTVTAVEVMVPKFIEINEHTKKYFLEHPEQCKAVMAHEMGHIANGDRTADSLALNYISPANQKREILA